MRVIDHAVVRDVLAGQEKLLIEVVREAYLAHHEGRTAVPHSSFLRFPGNIRDRIIALPAFLGGAQPIAGIKWIASFPDNIHHGLPRASAVILLNELDTGRPLALLEGSLISACRTAASAALAARLLVAEPLTGVAVIGCGTINLATLRFLACEFPGLAELTLYDVNPARAEEFARASRQVVPAATVRIVDAAESALAAHRLTTVATTATTAHLELADCPAGAVVLHLSLRDLLPTTVLDQRNVVDDADHVCRERTSLHLAEQLTGDRRFIHATIGELIQGAVPVAPEAARTTVFSPFGLGVLDLALARHVAATAAAEGRGMTLPDFLPGPAGPDPT